MAPNTQPIFIRKPFIWTALLQNQVVPRVPGAEVPLLIGTAGSDGSLIESIAAYPESDIPASAARVFGKGVNESRFSLLIEMALGYC